MGASCLSYLCCSVLGCGVWDMSGGAHVIISYFFPPCHAVLTRQGASVGVIAACVAEGSLAHCGGSCCMAGGWESQPPSSPPLPQQGPRATGCSNKSAQGSWLQSPQWAEKKRCGSQREERGREGQTEGQRCGRQSRGGAAGLSSRL